MMLFDPLEPYKAGHLDVGDGHSIYFEECGNPHGQPVVVLHGGPGGRINPIMRCFHDPKFYRIILFDQRGCGHSTPYASLHANTTWHLVADMEKLRQHLKVERWQVFGGSWGSTLALAYAQTHPDVVTGLILRGLFAVRRKEIQWFYQDGANWLYPDAWEGFLAPIPDAERGDLVTAYYKRLTSDDREVQLEAARAWSLWEAATTSLFEDPQRMEAMGADDFAIAFARIECHYFINGGFLKRDDQLIADVSKIRHIPAVLVQGRYDLCTPLRTAWDIAKAWPEAYFTIVPAAGHAVSEPGIAAELVMATQRFRV